MPAEQRTTSGWDSAGAGRDGSAPAAAPGGPAGPASASRVPASSTPASSTPASPTPAGLAPADLTPSSAGRAGAAPGRATADRARTIMAGARHALLSLPTGCRRPGSPGERGWVGLVDDGGEPVLLARADSAPDRATGRGSMPARADVPGPDGERLVLTGTLTKVPGSVETVLADIHSAHPSALAVVPDDDPTSLVALRLTVTDVRLGVLPAGSRRVGEWAAVQDAEPIGLDTYALAEPDLIAAYAPELVIHLNQAHGDLLRAVAINAAPGTLDVAGAYVSALDRTGLTLWRVVPSGAEPVRVPFSAPLAEPRRLGAELRRLLGQAPGNPR